MHKLYMVFHCFLYDIIFYCMVSHTVSYDEIRIVFLLLCVLHYSNSSAYLIFHNL